MCELCSLAFIVCLNSFASISCNTSVISAGSCLRDVNVPFDLSHGKSRNRKSSLAQSRILFGVFDSFDSLTRLDSFDSVKTWPERQSATTMSEAPDGRVEW